MCNSVIAKQLSGALTSGGSTIGEPSRLAKNLQHAMVATGWKRDALAAFMAERMGKGFDGSMLSHVFAGRNAVRPEYVDALPRDVRIELARLEWADLGFVVVEAADPLESLAVLTRGMVDQTAKLGVSR